MMKTYFQMAYKEAEEELRAIYGSAAIIPSTEIIDLAKTFMLARVVCTCQPYQPCEP